MKRLLLASTFLFGSLVPCPPAPAVVVVCANCSDLVTQLFQQAQAAQGLINQAAQLKTELSSFAQLVASGKALPQSIWSNVVGDINQIRNLANKASLLSGNSGTTLARLQDAQGYQNLNSYTPPNVGQTLAAQQQTLGNSAASLGRVLAVQQQQELGYAGQQQQISVHSETAAGQMQAIQAGNETLGLVSTQMNGLQVTLTAAAQEQATRDIVTADRTAYEDAAMQNLLQPTAIPLTGYQGY